MNIGVITGIMFGSFLLFVIVGVPVTWSIGGVAVLSAFFLWGPQSLGIMALHVWSQWTSPILMCIPLFVLLACLLQRSGMAEELYDTIYRWAGGLRGGLAMGTVVICTIFAAISGISAAGIITMALVALPSMFNRNYDKNIVLGGIVVGGVLGMLIPPSVVMIIYAFVARESVGRLWFAGFFPGLLCSTLYIIYIGIRCYLNPKLGPPVPPEERLGWREKIVSLRSIYPPLLVILVILLTIYLGICTPTEAGAIGCLGIVIVLGLRRRLSWSIVRGALYETLKLCAMVFWLFIAVTAFNSVYIGMGAREMIQAMVFGFGGGPFAILGIMIGILFIMGMFMDDYAVVLICAPIFAPIIKAIGLNSVWYGIIFIMNIGIAQCTPPYGWAMFLLRAVTPKGITMAHIYRSIYPFVILQLIGMGIVLLFPPIALWLPSMMITK